MLRHAPAAGHVDLRSPGQVRSLLAGAGIELPDTRASRLRALAGTHPLVDALLTWRKAERVATTYGYAWLDEHLGADGRLRGCWTGSDGAAGRMTASAGLHNMPAEMRPAVVAEAGHVFVRADLGQIEPRVLAAVSGDGVLARATLDDDMYAPVAAHLDVDRATAKVAVLGAMYGQTTGDGARALRRLEAAYPVAMAYLAEAYRSGQAGRDLRTYGGRLVRMSSGGGGSGIGEDRGAAAARGRYGRNALVQGAASELFKVWAVTVRARGGAMAPRSCCACTTSCWSTWAPKARWPWLSWSTIAFRRLSATRPRMVRCGSWPTLPWSSAGLMPMTPAWCRARTASTRVRSGERGGYSGSVVRTERSGSRGVRHGAEGTWGHPWLRGRPWRRQRSAPSAPRTAATAAATSSKPVPAASGFGSNWTTYHGNAEATGVHAAHDQAVAFAAGLDLADPRRAAVWRAARRRRPRRRGDRERHRLRDGRRQRAHPVVTPPGDRRAVQ